MLSLSFLFCVTVVVATVAARSSSSTLDAKAQDLNAFILSEMESSHIPGLSVIVVKNSTILFENAFGFSNPNASALVTNTNHTIFTLASVSKTVTSFGVMSLYDQGLFELDDDINEYLPFKVVNPFHTDKAISIRMLLTHMSSISDTGYNAVFPLVVTEGDPTISLADFMYDMFDTKGKYYTQLSFYRYAPGAEWEYSNMGATLAGYVAECIIKTKLHMNITLDEYILTQMFKPMGVDIHDVGFHLSDFSADDSLVTDFAIPSTWLVSSRKYKPYCLYGYPDYPDGLWRTSAINHAMFFSTFIDSGMAPNGHRILSAKTVNEMKTIQPGTPASQHQGIIWYYRRQPNGKQVIGHNGGDEGICTEAFFDPLTGVGFILFGNCDWTAQTTAAFFAIEDKILDLYDDESGDTDSADDVHQNDEITKNLDFVRYSLPHSRKNKKGNEHSPLLPCGL